MEEPLFSGEISEEHHYEECYTSLLGWGEKTVFQQKKLNRSVLKVN